MEWIFFEAKLPQQELVSTISPKDIRLTYSISYDGTISITQTDITLFVGQKLQLQRINRGLSERILYSVNSCIDEENDYFIATKPGKTTIKIIPTGYDIDKTVTINITVK